MQCRGLGPSAETIGPKLEHQNDFGPFAPKFQGQFYVGWLGWLHGNGALSPIWCPMNIGETSDWGGGRGKIINFSALILSVSAPQFRRSDLDQNILFFFGAVSVSFKPNYCFITQEPKNPLENKSSNKLTQSLKQSLTKLVLFYPQIVRICSEE